MKNNKAVTLIALIITIIILLILAGVVIAMTVGDNGLIKKALLAEEKYENAQNVEQIALEELEKQIANYNKDLPENTPENPQEMGKEVALKDGWGQETVYAVSVGNGNTVPVPKNFYYVGGTLDTGVIISDNREDRYGYNPETKKENDTSLDKTTYEYTRSLKGNQFVWIPCSTSDYNNTTPKLELTQIEKYSGFYVARYEAGLASTVSEYTDDIVHNQSFKDYNIEAVPQSKAGIIPWSFIDWTHSKTSAEKMYNNNYVRSGLITETQWDVMLRKMVGKTIGETTGNTKVTLTEADLTNSSKWGNYMDSSIPYAGRLARINRNSSSSAFILKPFGTLTTGTTTQYSSNNGDLLTTGASKTAQVYHIYDVAGNLWEWAEESISGQNRVSRGGGCIAASNASPASGRIDLPIDSTHPDVGFRAVLYIK